MEAPNFNADGNVDAGAENREVSVVIPMYTTQLNDFEVLSVRRTFDVLRDHDIVIIKPQSLDLQPLDQLLSGANCRVESFEDAYFQGRTGYNRLMMSPTFYERFLSSRYILICQTDVFIFSDRLLDWCKKDYDYVGAPWLPSCGAYTRKNWLAVADWRLRTFISAISPFYFSMKLKFMVGNGGLSLRRTQKCHALAVKYGQAAIERMEKHPNESRYYEDVFWSYHVNRFEPGALKIPPYTEAVGFSIDTHPATAFQISCGQLPFGAHAFYRRKHFGFWKKYIDCEAVMKKE